MILKAVRPILYRSTQYKVGQALPADNKPMVEAWLESGSAAWLDEETTTPPKAKPASAPAGKKGLSSDGDPEARVGRIPDKPERKTTTRRGSK